MLKKVLGYGDKNSLYGAVMSLMTNKKIINNVLGSEAFQKDIVENNKNKDASFQELFISTL